MNIVLDPIWTTLATAVAITLGTMLKKNENFKNRWIPLITLLTTFIGQVVAASTAAAFGLGDIMKGFTVVNSLFMWLTTTGIVSINKNLIMGKTSDPR